MYKVKLITTMAGPEGVFLSGSVAGFDMDTALNLIKSGYAVAIDEIKEDTEPVSTTQKVEKPKRGR